MSAIEALRMAKENGVHLGVEGTDLILDALREPPAPVLEELRRHKVGVIALLVAPRDGWAAEDWCGFFEERAGIAEFDGEVPRAEAETRAFECCVIEWQKRNPAPSDPGYCAQCGGANGPEHAVVPLGTDNHGRAGLHPECWNNWSQDRRERARRALAAMGLLVPRRLAERFQHVE